jgi:hypothetical protein
MMKIRMMLVAAAVAMRAAAMGAQVMVNKA